MATSAFGQKYPSLTKWASPSGPHQVGLTKWITDYGWMEIGQLDGPAPFIWALNEGGVIWEGKESYGAVDDAFRDAEKGIAAWIKDNLDDE